MARLHWTLAGEFKVQTNTVTTSGGLPRSMGNVSWRRIPRDWLGRSVNVELQACVKTSICSIHQVRIKAEAASGVTP